MSESVVIRTKKIKSREILRDALKHNLRAIPRELTSQTHIDTERTRLNIVLAGGTEPAEMATTAVRSVIEGTGKKLRKNGVLAIEYLFSLPIRTAVDAVTFFKDTLLWLEEYIGCPVISAVAHFDEAAPHLHVVVLPMRNGRMAGAEIVGFKGDLLALRRGHHLTVGRQYGLVLPEPVPRRERFTIARQVVNHVVANPQRLQEPLVQTAFIHAISMLPHDLAALFKIELPPPINNKPFPV